MAASDILLVTCLANKNLAMMNVMVMEKAKKGKLGYDWWTTYGIRRY